jgi:hypothetical protein
MTKRDVKKEYKQLYQPSATEFSVVEVPPMNFLMVDGHGDPNTSPVYQAALEALYSLAYTIKFALKPKGIDFVVGPPEGLWWMEDMREFSMETKDRWDWTMMIMQPDEVTQEVFEQAKIQVTKKKELPALPGLRLETYHEGLSVQILYYGAYADEGPTIARMHAFIHEQGFEMKGKHHEIYLGDPRRNPPEKLKTVIRQPIRLK